DENRTLIGNLSLGDVKYLIRKQYRHLLYGTALSLVQMVRYQQGIEEGKDRIPVFGVRPNATLRHIITKLHATGSHRIWVTTDESSMIPASMPFSSQPNVLLPTAAISASFGGSPNFPFSSTSGNASTASGLNYRRHSLVIPNSQPSIKARTEWNRRVSFSGQFDDAVCSV
ncbi:cell separation during budding, partial [Spiromyces aspiralis]